MNAVFFLPAFAISKSSVLDRNESNIIKTLPYGNGNLSEAQNTDILNSPVTLLLSSVCFEENLY